MKKEELMPLSEDLQALLLAEQAAPAMPAAMQAKISARLADSLMQPPSGPASGDAATSAGGETASSGLAEAGANLSPMAALAAKPALLALAAFGLGASAGIGGTLYLSSPEESPPPAAQVALIVPADAGPKVLPTPDARAAMPIDAAPIAEADSTPTQEVSGPKVSKKGTPGRDERLAAERSLLELARTALTRGDAATALGALKKHAHRHRRGQLAEERDALWVQALVLDGAFAKAKSKGKSFRAKYPKSLFKPVVDHVLEKVP